MDTLTGNTITGTGDRSPWVQYFANDGWTPYKELDTDRLTHGRWLVRGDQYCSQWTPSGRWDCYDLYSSGPDQVTFVRPDDNAAWPGRLTVGKGF